MSQMFIDVMEGVNAGMASAGNTIQQAQMQQVNAGWKNRDLAMKEELQSEQITSLRQSRDLAAVSSEREGKKLDQDILSSNKNMQLAVANYKLQEKQVLANLETGKITKEAAQLQLDEIKANKDLNAQTRALGLETVANKREQLKPLAEQAKTIWDSMGTGTPMPTALQNYLASAEIAALDPNFTNTTRARTNAASAANAGSAGTNELKSYVDNLESMADIKTKLDGMEDSPAKVELQAKYQEAIKSLHMKDATITGGVGVMATLTDKINNYVSQVDAAKAEIEDAKKGGGKANQGTEVDNIKAKSPPDLVGTTDKPLDSKNKWEVTGQAIGKAISESGPVRTAGLIAEYKKNQIIDFGKGVRDLVTGKPVGSSKWVKNRGDVEVSLINTIANPIENKESLMKIRNNHAEYSKLLTKEGTSELLKAYEKAGVRPVN
jgi:hypothetical protein